MLFIPSKKWRKDLACLVAAIMKTGASLYVYDLTSGGVINGDNLATLVVA